VAQVVEHLPSKHEALSLNPSTTKKKKEKKKVVRKHVSLFPGFHFHPPSSNFTVEHSKNTVRTQRKHFSSDLTYMGTPQSKQCKRTGYTHPLPPELAVVVLFSSHLHNQNF
jgi:hypothetical protein